LPKVGRFTPEQKVLASIRQVPIPPDPRCRVKLALRATPKTFDDGTLDAWLSLDRNTPTELGQRGSISSSL
jgi:hypothetical protein